MKKRFQPRVGLRVRSAFRPTHVFEIDASVRGERLYHEKNSDRWWLAGELRAATVKGLSWANRRAAGDLRPIPQGEVKRLGKMRANAYKAVPREGLKAPSTGMRVACLGCGKKFKPPRPWSKFHDKACHHGYWKRIRTAGKR